MANGPVAWGPTPNLEKPPDGYFVVLPYPAGEESDGIDVGGAFGLLRKHWLLFVIAVVVGAGIAAAISFHMRNEYRAQAILAPSAESNSGAAGGLKSEFGGLAALAGINLGGGGGRRIEALAILQSPGFVKQFIKSNDLLPILYEDRWDSAANNWKKDEKVPSIEEAAKLFDSQRIVTENTKTGLVTVSFQWYSAELAASWVNSMVDMVNERMRANDIETAQRSLEYLDKEMARANAVELRQAISRLIETQVNNQMLANVQRAYAYHFVDKAEPPQRKVAPKRSIITAAGAVVGFMLVLIFVIMRRRLHR